MPVSTLVTTAGSAFANAYADLTFANQYFTDRPLPSPTVTAWRAATDDNKNGALLFGTLLMDRMWTWTGYPTDAIQALLWPRGGMLKPNGWEYVDIHTIPIELQRATAEYAGQLLVGDRTADSAIQTQGITSVKAGSVQIDFKDSVFAKTVPDAVYNLIPSGWGYPNARQMGVRDLIRA